MSSSLGWGGGASSETEDEGLAAVLPVSPAPGPEDEERCSPDPPVRPGPPPRNCTRSARTFILLLFCPSCSHWSRRSWPSTKTGRPLVRYCLQFSAVRPQTSTSTKVTVSLMVPSCALKVSLIASPSRRPPCPSACISPRDRGSGSPSGELYSGWRPWAIARGFRPRPSPA